MEAEAERWEEEKTVRQEALGLGGMDLFRAHLARKRPSMRPSRMLRASGALASCCPTRLPRPSTARFSRRAPGRFDTSDRNRAHAAAEREREAPPTGGGAPPRPRRNGAGERSGSPAWSG